MTVTLKFIKPAPADHTLKFGETIGSPEQALFSSTITTRSHLSASLTSGIRFSGHIATVGRLRARLGSDWEEAIYIDNFMILM